MLLEFYGRRADQAGLPRAPSRRSASVRGVLHQRSPCSVVHGSACPGASPAGVLSWDDTLKHVTVVRINAITVPADSGDELARRFAARAGAVDNQDGFEGFELLKPTDGRTTWLVLTRWRDEAAFQAWMHSAAFGHGHRSAAERAGGEAPPPVGIGSELWSYEVAGGSSR
jgi:heme oxygenase (mycobilin-producing)